MTPTLERAELRRVRMRLKSPFMTSFGVEQDRECLILCLHADGLSGWGECVAGAWPGYSYETTATAWHVLVEFFLPQVLGKPLPAPAELSSRLAAYRGHPMARAALEMCLWDLAGKSSNQSLQDMLGGEQKAVPVGVSIGIQESPKDLVAVAAAYIEEGYQRLKLKVKPGRDVQDVAAVRDRFPDQVLQIDANSAYTLEQQEVFLQLDEFDLLLIEQPLAEDDLVDHSRLQKLLKTPLCLDESILSARHARQALEIDACRIVNIKPARVGGISEAVRIHNECGQHGAPVWCGGMLESGIGRASNLALASLPGFTLAGDISATDRYYDQDVTAERFKLNPDSTIDVPQGPGLGIEIDEETLDRFTLLGTEIRG